ncbi:Rab-like_protein [Hexamita inflata]|uniref:Rab-like protein n=1 Tax=Hexamita inflata TaxID=28002 RepID=A0AA86V0L2_9EUKA|nr:Rab-like protein [Hexamita inflata]
MFKKQKSKPLLNKAMYISKKEENKNNSNIYKILVICASNSGKSHLVSRLMLESEYVQGRPILEFCTRKIIIQAKNKDVESQFQFWDISGAEQFDLLLLQQINQGNMQSIIIVVDSTNEHSYKQLEAYIQQIKLYTKYYIQLLVLANKTDLIDENNSFIVEQLEQVAATNMITFERCSALLNTGVLQALIK